MYRTFEKFILNGRYSNIKELPIKSIKAYYNSIMTDKAARVIYILNHIDQSLTDGYFEMITYEDSTHLFFNENYNNTTENIDNITNEITKNIDNLGTDDFDDNSTISISYKGKQVDIWFGADEIGIITSALKELRSIAQDYYIE